MKIFKIIPEPEDPAKVIQEVKDKRITVVNLHTENSKE